MDFDWATETVRNRVEKVEPELANKIIGYLLLSDNIDREMIRLALGPDCVIDSAVKEAKSALGFGSLPISLISPVAKPIPEFPLDLFPLMVHHPISASPGLHVSPAAYWDSLTGTDNHFPSQHRDVMISQPNPNIAEKHRLVNRFLTEENPDLRLPDLLEFPEDNMNNQDYTLFPFPVEDFSLRTGRRTTSFADSHVKTCHYYYNGYCKHGASCRYYHGQSVSDILSKPWKSNHNDIPGEDSSVSSGSLERLESEIVELLKSHGGQCVSISMLPVLYSERYGRSLQADGYLTESQRHGKIGFSLTKLLARLRNSIRIIDRPHGQHSVVLVGDTGRNLENRCQTSDHGNAVTSSQQIYLTFPAESTFTEEDVSNYFNRFGTVHAVRIPPQQKRMFGFVTFVLPETVKIVLSKGNPHLICGARVLAKPYREKARNYERRYSERIDIPAFQSSHHLDFQNRFICVPRALENTSRRQLWVEHELDQQLKRFNSLQLASRQYRGNNLYDMQGASRLEDGGQILSMDCPVPQLGTRNCNGVIEDISRGTFNNFSHRESSHVDLPENAFASSSLGSGIQHMHLP